MSHERNTGPMMASKRCGAKTRSGKPCQAPAVAGKARCRMHGGARGSGAPLGNDNAYKHGAYSQATLEDKAHARAAFSTLRKILKGLKG